MRILCAAFLSVIALLNADAAAGLPDELKTGGFAIGCQAWSFNKFTVFEAIAKTQEAGGKVIEFFPGQKLSPEAKDVAFDHHSTAEVREKVLEECRRHGLQPIAYGVVDIPKDETGARQVFEFAKAMGIRVINTESVAALDTFEKLVREFDIKVGFHDHPKRPENPDYRMWDPNYILEITKDRDPRIGACADIGHWVRSGLKPVDCLRILKGRIVSSHLKDLHVALPSGHDVPYGTGVSEIGSVLEEFRAQGFEGPISVEYEYHWENNTDEVKQCIDFVRGGGGKR